MVKMSKCLSCEKSTNGEMVVVIDSDRRIDVGYSYFYSICNRCQIEMLKTLEAITNMVKRIQDYDERREKFSETRNWCRECWQDISLKNQKNPDPRWAVLFVDVNSYVKNTSYIHRNCCKKFLAKFGIYNKNEYRKPDQTELHKFTQVNK